MGNIEERIAFIKEQLGDRALEMLKDYGTDINAVIAKVAAQDERMREGLQLQADAATLADIMTSELVYRSGSPRDVYGREFTRRLKAIDLSDMQIASMYQMQSLILSIDGLEEDRAIPWVRRKYFESENPELFKLPEEWRLTLSESIAITDEATYYHSMSRSLPVEIRIAISNEAMQGASMGGAKIARALYDQLIKLEWSPAQGNALVRNESLLLERLKWGDHNEPAWTPETCNLSQYER